MKFEYQTITSSQFGYLLTSASGSSAPQLSQVCTKIISRYSQTPTGIRQQCTAPSAELEISQVLTNSNRYQYIVLHLAAVHLNYPRYSCTSIISETYSKTATDISYRQIHSTASGSSTSYKYPKHKNNLLKNYIWDEFKVHSNASCRTASQLYQEIPNPEALQHNTYTK